MCLPLTSHAIPRQLPGLSHHTLATERPHDAVSHGPSTNRHPLTLPPVPRSHPKALEGMADQPPLHEPPLPLVVDPPHPCWHPPRQEHPLPFVAHPRRLCWYPPPKAWEEMADQPQRHEPPLPLVAHPLPPLCWFSPPEARKGKADQPPPLPLVAQSPHLCWYPPPGGARRVSKNSGQDRPW